MNVSMMDSYNLSWKLAYFISGLAPENLANKILDTYHIERHTIAQQLIEFDKAFSSMFSGKIGASEDGVSSLTHDEFLEVFNRGNGFTSGCGVEYPDSMTVNRSFNGREDPIHGTDYLAGILHPGRRLLNVRLVRHADGYRRDLQDGKIECK
jgi:phenol 2-monooxygenase